VEQQAPAAAARGDLSEQHLSLTCASTPAAAMAPSRLTVALAPFRPRTVIGLAAISELAWRPPHGTSCGKDWETPSFPLIPSRWRWATRHPGPPAPAVATSDGRGHREQGDGQVFNVLISSCLPPTVGPGAHLEAAPPRFDSWHVVDWRCRPSLHCSETHLTRGGLPLSSLESRSPSSSKALDPLWKPSPSLPLPSGQPHSGSLRFGQVRWWF
jgi:hypothetical protein